MALRKDDVASKLSYAHERFQSMMDELFAAKKEARDPKNLVHAAADVLSNSRECFDYLGQDILETHILPLTQNTDLLTKHKQGKIKAYFPFYESQLKKKAIYAELRATAPALHTRLLSFASDINRNNKIPNTLFKCGLFEELRDIVNHKKHDRLIAVVSEKESEFLIEQPGMKMLIPRDGQQGWKSFSVSPGTEVSKVSEYRFEFNKREVADFCMFAYRATELVTKGFYEEFF